MGREGEGYIGGEGLIKQREADQRRRGGFRRGRKLKTQLGRDVAGDKMGREGSERRRELGGEVRCVERSKRLRSVSLPFNSARARLHEAQAPVQPKNKTNTPWPFDS